MLTSSPASGDLFCVDLGMVIPAVFPMRRIEELPAMFDDRAGGGCDAIWCSRAPPRSDVELSWRCCGATAACTSSGCSCAKPRPLVGNERLFLFGERCLQKGRSAAAGGRGRNGLHEGCRQRLSAEAHGHGVLLLCAGCAMSARCSSMQYGDVLDKNISLNLV